MGRLKSLIARSAPLLEVVITARPSWARVKSLIFSYSELVGPEKCRVSLVGPALSARYGDISSQIPPNISVRSFPTLRESDDLGAVALTGIDTAYSLATNWAQSRPDCILVIADRTETLGVSMAAALMQIPLIHLQGGEVSGSIDNKIRDTNTKLADFHLTTNDESKQYLLGIGEDETRIKVIGCPSIDGVKHIMEENKPWNLLDLGGVGCDVNSEQEYGIIMFHPDTLDDSSNSLWVYSLIEAVGTSILSWFWFWPNPDHGSNEISKIIRRCREQGLLQNVRFIINVTPDDFVRLATRACILIGNSSFGIRESSYIGLPTLNLGLRQNGRQRGSNVVDLPRPSANHIHRAILELAGKKYPSSKLYGDGSAGLRGAQFIASWNPRLKGKID